MRVTYAQFNVEYRDIMYAVQMSVQYTYNNTTYATVHVMQIIPGGERRTLLTESVEGRQILSPINAKQLLRKALIAEGVIKETAREEEPSKEIDVSHYTPVVVDMKVTPGAKINDNSKPTLISKILELFK